MKADLPAWLVAEDTRIPADVPRLVPSSRQELGTGLPRLPIEWAAEVNPQLHQLWLVKSIFPREGLVVLYGHPGSGKSFLALDFGMHIALGRQWHGRQTRQGTVVYVAAEGQDGLRKRIAAFMNHHHVSGAIPFALIPRSMDLFGCEADRLALREAVARAAGQAGVSPALIVIDTVSKTLGNGRENTDDLGAYVGHCGSLATHFKCCVLLIHHRPKDAISNDPRGHGSLAAGVDTTLLVRGGSTRTVSITKQRDGKDGDLFRFSLLPVRIGEDEGGEPVESCVVARVMQASNADARPSSSRQARELTKSQLILLQALDEAADCSDQNLPPSIPADIVASSTKIARWADVRKIAFERSGTSSDKKSDSIRRAVRRAESALQASGKIVVLENYIWRGE